MTAVGSTIFDVEPEQAARTENRKLVRLLILSRYDIAIKGLFAHIK